MVEYFSHNERLGISIPSFDREWDQYPNDIKEHILYRWESIRGRIPDRIAELEDLINTKQAQLNDEGNFIKSCELNSEISELASIINDLWLWYRTHQDISEKAHL
ncbi:hypothetical protein RRV45_16980 [Bacillus sp. DTU_2020_1000418_1_SI_GHA_SEK_038]|uniref:hypothetical protein n=1 Tax=Bacillus sp. DTU_2020_1000418_1_SI_GHA_SEK_038 TaxID=3077585 RepID=UPI0028EFBCA1|nr:hypothetical protein [Bacillus sp. DTU_2020_1000418_1_SI_GHA_SEK_038]WNS74589.1 hypothetical protein RRV45_16980 [Bacillus sp. DTU_2020_1000418_1_SI_GHA_SEK_038]